MESTTQISTLVPFHPRQHTPIHRSVVYFTTFSTVMEGIACIQICVFAFLLITFEAIPKCQGPGSWAWVASSCAERHKKILYGSTNQIAPRVILRTRSPGEVQL